MPNAPVPAAAIGLPTLTPDQAIANLRAGLVTHFAGFGQTIDFDGESVETARHRIRGLRLAIAARIKAEGALIDAIASRRVG